MRSRSGCKLRGPVELGALFICRRLGSQSKPYEQGTLCASWVLLASQWMWAFASPADDRDPGTQAAAAMVLHMQVHVRGSAIRPPDCCSCGETAALQ
jgi:hypothetical protein